MNVTKDPKTEAPPSGVYKNERLMYACTTIVGSLVRLQTKDDSVFEGLWNTFSSEFIVCLDYAVKIDPSSSSDECLYKALKSGTKANKQAFFQLKEIVRITVSDVDLNFAIKDSAKLTTDADISGFNADKLGGPDGEHRQLESWQDDDGDNVNSESLQSLDEPQAKTESSPNNARGWDAQEMFRYNERVHKVTTTYDEKLTDYTLPLPKHSSEEWRKKQKRAAAIAKEIEGNTKSQTRLAKEDEGDCEEEKFSAVVRPTPAANQALPQHQHQHQPHQHTQHQQTQHQHQHPLDNQQHQQQAHTHQQQSHQQSHQQQQLHHQHQTSLQQQQGQLPRVTHKNFRPRPVDRKGVESLKNFGRQLNLGPSPRHNRSPISQTSNAATANTETQSVPAPTSNVTTTSSAVTSTSSVAAAAPSSAHAIANPSSANSSSATPTSAAPATATASATMASTTQASVTPAATTASASGPTNTPSSSNQPKDQKELAKNSTLNPNAKEFVYKPRSPATDQVAGSAIDTSNSSPMSQAPHAPYYQQVPVFTHGLTPHQQHHHAQLMPNHGHPHFQSQIHYMSPMPPHFPQQAPHAPYYQQVPVFTHGLSPHQQHHHHAQLMPNHGHPHFQNQMDYMSPMPPHFPPQVPLSPGSFISSPAPTNRLLHRQVRY